MSGPRRSLAALTAENKRLERELTARTVELSRAVQEERFLKAILDRGPDAMLVADAAGFITRFSPAAVRLFGWPMEEAIGKHLSVIMPLAYPAQDKDAEDDGSAHRFPKVIGVDREAIGRRRGGAVFEMMLHVAEVHIGKDRHYVKFVRDLTPVREAERRAQALHMQLTRASGLESTGAVAAVLAHELNQPLGAITSYVEGVKALLSRRRPGDVTPTDAIEALDGARDQAVRAGEIIRRIRTLVAGDEAGRRQVSIRSVILEVDFMVGLLTRDGGVTVLYDLSIAEDPVLADSVQIQQVVLNLVRNAVEAMGDASDRRIEISCRLEDQDWVVGVEDSGPGLTPEIEERLFTGQALGANGGLGLGLSISKTIVEHHGGRIWAGRSRWQGGAFYFSLPCAAPAKTPAESQNAVSVRDGSP